MDIGAPKPIAQPGEEAAIKLFKPFARPKRKRRRIMPSKPAITAVRPNPAHYVLNFTAGDKPERSLVTIVSSDRKNVSLVGLPGSGKTVILRALAYHSTVQGMFRDGIFLVQLSTLTTVTSFFDHLTELLEKLGAPSQVETFRDALRKTPQNHQNAIDAFISIIRDKIALLIFDNVSSHPPDVYNLLTMFVDATPRGRRFALVCSTRSHDVAKMFSSGSVVDVPLHDPTGDSARDILCSHAGFVRTHFDKSCQQPGNAIVPVLYKCSGLPLALAVAGGAVKRLLVPENPDEMNALIWSHYRSYLINSFDQFGQISGLFSGLSSCVESVPVDKDWKTDLSVWDVFCSLGIVQNGTWVPYHILQRLWGMKKRDDVISVVRPLSRHCLITRDRRGSAVGVVVADVVLDYCRHEAGKRMGLRKWHLNLLSSYITQARSVTESGKPMNRYAEEMQYLRENLAHHTKEALENANATDDVSKFREVTEGATRVIFDHILKGGAGAGAGAGVGATANPTKPDDVPKPKPTGVYFINED